MEENMYWYWLSYLNSMEVNEVYKLLEYYGEAKNIYYSNDIELVNLVTERSYSIIVSSRDEKKIIESYKNLKNKNIKYIARIDKEFPEQLYNVYPVPFGIYLKGSLPSKALSIAIIGARAATPYGKEIAKMFSKELSRYGVNIISGLATGIDGRAHIGALDMKGYTLGILGGGIDSLYPRENYRLYEAMEGTGGIISEYGVGFKPKSRWFPERNRLISGMAEGILVVEAKVKSGSLITIDLGMEQGKNIYAIPGKIGDKNSEGCNNIIKQGAKLVTSVEEILEDFYQYENIVKLGNRSEAKMEAVEKSLANEEKIVYSFIRLEPKHVDDIINYMDLPIQEVTNILFTLEIKGYIKQVTKNYYIADL